MKMKYNLGKMDLVVRAAGGDVEIKIDGVELEQEFSAEDLIKIGIPAIKELAELAIKTQRELCSQANSNTAREINLQEKKIEEEVRRNRRIFQPNKKESQ